MWPIAETKHPVDANTKLHEYPSLMFYDFDAIAVDLKTLEVLDCGFLEAYNSKVLDILNSNQHPERLDSLATRGWYLKDKFGLTLSKAVRDFQYTQVGLLSDEEIEDLVDAYKNPDRSSMPKTNTSPVQALKKALQTAFNNYSSPPLVYKGNP